MPDTPRHKVAAALKISAALFIRAHNGGNRRPDARFSAITSFIDYRPPARSVRFRLLPFPRRPRQNQGRQGCCCLSPRPFGLQNLKVVERAAARCGNKQHDKQNTHAAAFSSSGGCSVSSGSGSASTPAHSLMLTLQTGQAVLTLPATHLSVQLQTGASVCPSSIRAVKSASSTWLRKWTVFSPSSARSMMM